jgi:heavy metal translocating P-type ATPase
MNLHGAQIIREAPPVVRPLCVHCGNEIPARLAGARFCCKGCETVFGLLRERGLGRFYEIRAKDQPVRRSQPADAGEDNYAFLDDAEFESLYVKRQGDRKSMRFYLDGAHCAACVWLTERVGDFVPGVRSARLSLGDSVAEVALTADGSFAAVAREFARLGYRPHPVRDDEADALAKVSDRWLLARTGVAGACAGNIMLLAVSLYAGADGGLAGTFRWTSLVLSLPVLLFSAQPFYRGAWRAIRSRQVSIDLPIALGIALGGLSSVYNLVTGSPYLYFDSLAMLVFLMLASRYLLVKTQRAAAYSSKLIRFVTPATARVVGSQAGTFRDVPVDRVRAGDEVEVFAGECVPVDGVVAHGNATLDNSLLTGESMPVAVAEDEPVFAGTVCQGAPIRIRATASGISTRLARTLAAVESDLARKAPIATFADRVARIFVVAVLVSVAIVFLVGLRQGLHEAVNLALALSIVTCPCAFALATPLALSLSLGRCAREGVLIKGADVLERLTRVDEVIFDKTGTLTVGRFAVLGWDPELKLESDSELICALLALETRSRHPVARALLEKFGEGRVTRLPEVTGFAEEFGHGVSGATGGHRYEISGWRAKRGAASETYAGATCVGVWRDKELLGRIYLGDELRESSPAALGRLREMGMRIGVFSGDSHEAVASVRNRLGLPSWRVRSQMSPEDKRREIKALPRALMVGDGANDAGALAAAYVGLAVHGGVEVSLRSADIYSRRPGVEVIPPLLTVARETLVLIRRNFALSLVYNAVGITGVLLGWVTPLFAAVLMPLSAITVFLSSMAGTSRLRRALAELRR